MHTQTNYTAKSCAKDAAYERAQRFQSDTYRVLSPDTRTLLEKSHPEPTAFEVLRDWTFAVHDFGCWDDATTGKPVLRSMLLTDPNNPENRFIVTHDARSNQWRCQCPRFKGHWGLVCISAVQMRVTNHPLALAASGKDALLS